MPPSRSPPLSPSLTLYEPSLRVQQALGRQGRGEQAWALAHCAPSSLTSKELTAPSPSELELGGSTAGSILPCLPPFHAD